MHSLRVFKLCAFTVKLRGYLQCITYLSFCYCKSSAAKKSRVRLLWSSLIGKQYDKCIFTLFWCLFVVFVCRVAFASMGDHKGRTLHINFIFINYIIDNQIIILSKIITVNLQRNLYSNKFYNFSKILLIETASEILPFTSEIFTRSCAVVSLWRIVTIPSSSVWWSIVTQKGVPSISWRV